MAHSWLDKFVDQHSDFESPLSFWRWAGICSVAAILKDNVYLKQRMFNLYPNIYVMFHADSGLKKGPPVNAAKKLVKHVGNTTIISGRSSIQGILRKLGSGESSPGGKIKKSAAAFICSSELSSSIVDDPAATDILTDLYDRSYNAGDWGSILKTEEFTLKDVTLTMLTATNDAHSSVFFERKDVSGGFLARTFVIQESKENRPNSLIVIDDEAFIDYELLARYLKELAELKGAFIPLGNVVESEYHYLHKKNPHTQKIEYFTPAGLLYENWYEDFKGSMKDADDKTGTLNRLGASVLKVAMICSLCEEPRLEISESAMQTAIDLCEKLVANIRKVTFGRQEQDPSDAVRKKALILELMQRDPHSITHAQLYKKFWMHGTVNEWGDVLISLEQAGIIEVKKLGPNNVLIEMKAQAYEEFRKRLEGKEAKV